MKKTIKMAAIKKPGNYWIRRRVWEDEIENEFVKINYNFIAIAWLEQSGWEIDIAF